jgi:YegS/Rv2252/BmrU family lipid kinase
MTKGRAFVVLNPVAGTEDPDEVRSTIVSGLEAANWDYDIHRTSEEEDVERAVRDSSPEDYDVVIASGGDGTISAVASALTGTDTPLGIIPSGTGNSLARDLDIPLAIDEAMQIITGKHDARPIDGLRIDDRHYFLNASVGVSADAMVHTERTQKRRLGMTAYLITTLQKMVGMQPAKFKVTADGEVFRMQAADILVANSGIVGISRFNVKPAIYLDDGEVGIFILRARSALDYIIAVWAGLTGQAPNAPNVRVLRVTHSVTVEPSSALPKQADGESLGRGGFTAYVVPQAVRVIVASSDDHKQSE